MTVHPIVLPTDSAKLSKEELEQARLICREVAATVTGRDAWIEKNNVSKQFAYPDANWNYDTSNNFLKSYRRITTKCSEQDIHHLRAFTSVFTGWSLYDHEDGADKQASNLKIDDRTIRNLQQKIEESKGFFVKEHEDLTRGVTEDNKFKPPQIFGESGHLVDDIIVNNDTNTYQERLNLINFSGISGFLKQLGHRTIRVLEIGSGYGALAYWLLGKFDDIEYVALGVPESLMFAKLYLTLSLKEKGSVAPHLPWQRRGFCEQEDNR